MEFNVQIIILRKVRFGFNIICIRVRTVVIFVITQVANQSILSKVCNLCSQSVIRVYKVAINLLTNLRSGFVTLSSNKLKEIDNENSNLILQINWSITHLCHID